MYFLDMWILFPMVTVQVTTIPPFKALNFAYGVISK